VGARVSAGLLVYRLRAGNIEVLLVHPGGPFWRRKDLGSWSIPKGETEPGEDLLAVAQREFEEETGVALAGDPVALTPVKQGSGKLVHAFALEGDLDASAITSNTFTLEWPPRSGRMATFPEVDRAQWFDLVEAERRILPAQAPLLHEIAAAVARARSA
jgi:predicted NUDIX family NTP pyrophosphohydrolase